MHSLLKTSERAAINYWKLEAIDSIRLSGNSKLAEVECMKIIDILLDDTELKDIYHYDNGFFKETRPQKNEHKRELLLHAVNQSK